MFDLFERFVALPTVTHFLIGTMLAVHYAIAPRLGMWAFSVLSLPSTLAHELGHWFVALVLGARPSSSRTLFLSGRAALGRWDQFAWLPTS